MLRGLGVSLALPLLDSMIPALQPLAKAAAHSEGPALRRHIQPARMGAGILADATARRDHRVSIRSEADRRHGANTSR